MGLFDNLTPEARLMMGAGIMGGQNLGQGLAQGAQMAMPMMLANQQKTEAQAVENKTREWLQKQYPGEDFTTMTPDTVKMYLNKAVEQRFAKPVNDFKVLPDGTYGTWDGTKFNTLGTSTKPVEATAIQRDLQAAGLKPGSPEYQKAILENYRKNGGQDDYANRQAMAEQLGMKPDDPAYRAFILTGKLPREDQQALTAVDKKAILEADEMVAVNEGAINALKQAKELSPKANAGWGAATRASLGANLPDWMVPDDYVSSPESSAATQNFDNLVVSQALTQLKAIFGGAPTEGERKILLDLQGSSNLQPTVREDIINKAIAMAERRLEFNKQRADDLRGGTYYKPNSTTSTQPTTTGGKTSSGLNFTVEP